MPTVRRVDDSPVRARRHRKNTRVGRRVEGLGRRGLPRLRVAGGGYHHDAMGDRILDRLLLVDVRAAPSGVGRAREARERHVDHLGASAHSFINAGRLVRRVAVASVVQHLEIDHLRVPSQPSYADAVVCGRSDQARYECAVPVLVVRRGAKWPVVLADVLAHNNLSDQLGVFWVNASVQDRYEGVGATSGDGPGHRGIYGLKVGLPPRVLDRRSRPTAGVLDDHWVPGIGPPSTWVGPHAET